MFFSKAPFCSLIGQCCSRCVQHFRHWRISPINTPASTICRWKSNEAASYKYKDPWQNSIIPKCCSSFSSAILLPTVYRLLRQFASITVNLLRIYRVLNGRRWPIDLQRTINLCRRCSQIEVWSPPIAVCLFRRNLLLFVRWEGMIL